MKMGFYLCSSHAYHYCHEQIHQSITLLSNRLCRYIPRNSFFCQMAMTQFDRYLSLGIKKQTIGGQQIEQNLWAKGSVDSSCGDSTSWSPAVPLTIYFLLQIPACTVQCRLYNSARSVNGPAIQLLAPLTEYTPCPPVLGISSNCQFT